MVLIALLPFAMTLFFATTYGTTQQEIAFIEAPDGPIKVRSTVSCDDHCAWQKAWIARREKNHCPTIRNSSQPCL
jgi:hypothetical protein